MTARVKHNGKYITYYQCKDCGKVSNTSQTLRPNNKFCDPKCREYVIQHNKSKFIHKHIPHKNPKWSPYIWECICGFKCTLVVDFCKHLKNIEETGKMIITKDEIQEKNRTDTNTREINMEIKFRQPLYFSEDSPWKGKFMGWYCWGDVESGFNSPINRNLDRNSQQCFGDKDGKNKDIYVGDIVKTTNPNGDFISNLEVLEKGIIEGPYDCFGDGFEITLIGWAINEGFKFEIIGNIIENPELLQEV